MIKRKAISTDWYKSMETAAKECEQDKIIRNSILNVGLDETALDHEAKSSQHHTFSLELETGDITSQMKSGRCWLFAGLNTMRFRVMNNLKLKNFELSQSHAMFFDKLEKANYFLENILETLDEETDSRLIMYLLDAPLQDGGQWDMFTALIEKYGVVPKAVMPETYSSSNTARMNSILTLTLRGFAKELREASAKSESEEKLQARKKEMMDEFYRLLTLFLGVPPTEFDFEYVDKDKKYHADRKLTAKAFYDKYVDMDLSNYISIINAPTQNKPFNKTFTVQYLGNVEGGNPVKYLNLDMKTFKALAIKQLKDKDPVWFGSDVGKKMKREEGILDENVFAYEQALGTQFKLDKAGRLDYGDSLMTHAMVLAGVNLIDDKPNRWKVENSWGDKNGNKGYFVMSDAWFDQYVYQIVIDKKYLTPDQLKAWETKPIELKPWDPMGSLA
jgi:bleomycin hydrolase